MLLLPLLNGEVSEPVLYEIERLLGECTQIHLTAVLLRRLPERLDRHNPDQIIEAPDTDWEGRVGH